MSVFGGDSWGREAQYRKRRVDDLVVEGLDASSFKKLSNGKFACLVCPNSPIFDTPLMLSMHCKGSRHRAAESKLTERKLIRHNEMNKRIALSDCSSATAAQCSLTSKPLIEQSRKAVSEILCGSKTSELNAASAKCGVRFRYSGDQPKGGESNFNDKGAFLASGAAGEVVLQQQWDFQKRRERELKFTAAGWKRDCHGKWFKDENVEFDSDEEDPNVCLG